MSVLEFLQIVIKKCVCTPNAPICLTLCGKLRKLKKFLSGLQYKNVCVIVWITFIRSSIRRILFSGVSPSYPFIFEVNAMGNLRLLSYVFLLCLLLLSFIMEEENMKQKQVLEIIYEGKTVKVKKSWLMRILRKIFRVNRKQKDRLFLKVFSEKKALLELYNAVNHSDYTNADELVITTLEDAVYMGMKNDCSFLIGNYLNLYEHQSTFNPNMRAT